MVSKQTKRILVLTAIAVGLVSYDVNHAYPFGDVDENLGAQIEALYTQIRTAIEWFVSEHHRAEFYLRSSKSLADEWRDEYAKFLAITDPKDKRDCFILATTTAQFAVDHARKAIVICRDIIDSAVKQVPRIDQRIKRLKGLEGYTIKAADLSLLFDGVIGVPDPVMGLCTIERAKEIVPLCLALLLELGVPYL